MNYVDTFIQVAPDCPVQTGVVPSTRGERKPAHVLQYELISKNPYRYTQEDVQWQVHVLHKAIPARQLRSRSRQMRDDFLNRPQACLRSSALAKRYGWGFHFDKDGGIALYAVESPEYHRFTRSGSRGPKLLSAMRSKRA